MADKLGIHPKDLGKYRSKMKFFGINAKHVTDHHIRMAIEIDRSWQESLKSRVLALGGTWK